MSPHLIDQLYEQQNEIFQKYLLSDLFALLLLVLACDEKMNKKLLLSNNLLQKIHKNNHVLYDKCLLL